MIVSFFEYFIPFVVLLSIVVFLHELGHYLVARWYGVTVEVFSLGFGPKILKFKKGDTVYCLSLIPLGGYVKMFGDNPRASVPKAQQRRAFLCQKTGPKIAIALAGPVMNFILAVFLFIAIGMMNNQKALPKLGELTKESGAYRAGFRSGDLILAVNNQPVSYWEDVTKWIKKNPEKNLAFDVQRQSSRLQIKTAPKKAPQTHLTALSSTKGEIEGLTIASKSAHIGIHNVSSPAYLAGLRTFDEITKINDQKISNWRDMEQFFENHFQALDLKITAKRDELSVAVKIPKSSFSSLNLASLGIEKSDLYIHRVKPSSPAEKAGLQAKDRLFALDRKKLSHWDEFAGVIQSQKQSSKTFHLTIVRQGEQKTLTLKAEKTPRFQPDGRLTHQFMIGVASAQFISYPDLVSVKMMNPLKAFSYGVTETLRWAAITGKIMFKLITGSVSSRLMGGPLSIAKAAKASFFDNLIQFLSIMAIISVNLGLINLFPIPILDGGHILLFTIEWIKGRPLSVRKIEIIQTAGFVFVLFLIIFTLVNDVQNWNIIW